ncbi:methyltransferase [Pelagibacteraceae bacterium]|nr:methyltransferase [Pelagibacteraceae bacterium]
MSDLFDDINFKLNQEENFNFKIKKNLFTPTGTTNLLLNSIIKYNPNPGKLLDLGAGIGINGIILNLKKIAISPVYLSDLNEKSVDCINENAKSYNCNVIAKEGSLFEPWKNYKFDLIVNDVSGISSKIAEISNWFRNVPCDSDEDGTKLTIDIIKGAKKYLEKNGKLFLPIISLCNRKKIIAELKKNYTSIHLLENQEWPLPKEIAEHKDLLDQLEKENKISLKSKFGMKIFETSIYMVY